MLAHEARPAGARRPGLGLGLGLGARLSAAWPSRPPASAFAALVAVLGVLVLAALVAFDGGHAAAAAAAGRLASGQGLLGADVGAPWRSAREPGTAAGACLGRLAAMPRDRAAQERVALLGGLHEDSVAGWVSRWRRSSAQRVKQRESEQRSGAAFFQRNWHPSFSCPSMERMGGAGDGGKWCCNPSVLATRPSLLVYSLGSNGDFTFEAAVRATFGDRAEVHTFDAAPSFPNTPAFVTYHAVTVARYDDDFSNARRFKTLLHELGHEHRTVDVLKVDVEGSELDVLSSAARSGALAHVEQILVEVHLDPRRWPEVTPGKVHALMSSLAALGFEIFAKEPNTEFAGGNACEFGLVRVPWAELCEERERAARASAPVAVSSAPGRPQPAQAPPST